jgi:type I restriction enzyme R subunit
MGINQIHLDETKQSQLPFVELLINMGYRYISTKQVEVERGHDMNRFILRQTARTKLMEINAYERNGERYKFSEKDIEEAIDELENIPLEGVVDTSKKIYSMIMPKKGGKTIKVMKDGRSTSENFRFIDFENISHNDLAVAVEFTAAGKSNIRVDIVVFVNGIPFVLIENKKSSVAVEKGIQQHLRNQKTDYCPRLFIYPQLLVSANKEDFRYGTLGTPEEFYATWREKDVSDLDNKAKKIITKPIQKNIYQQLLIDLNGSTFAHTQNCERVVTFQDKNVVAFFEPERMLDLAKNFILYDAGIKKVMRYQQYFAIKKILNRVHEKEIGPHGEKRKGGIVWHTQGSGKSLTMVMFVKALIEDPNIVNPRVLIVTDRKDLDRQIKTTFINAGLKKEAIQAKSGEHLLELLEKKNRGVITTLVQKFQSARNKPERFQDLDQNIFVLIDEAHRSQGGDANIEMNRVIPNACYIAFTGTPLLKDEKSNKKFGEFIDKYTIDDALNDGIVLPLIYEGRYVDLKQDRGEIDRLFARLTEDLDEELKHQLQKNIEKKILKDNPKRITEIAYDIEKHYLKRFAGTGLKAQIVAPSKFSAVLFQKYFSQSAKIKTALVVSDENGIIDDKDEHKKEVEAYLKNIKENYQSLLTYEKEVIESFKYNDDGMEILIVVDKLLTGFDAPRNTVLYLTKTLKDHNLLQAIARVNRLYDNAILPKTAGYIIDYSENAQNIRTAMELFGNYDDEDVKHTLIDVSEKIRELETSYGELHDIFKTTANDDEAYLQYLGDEAIRKQFYDALNGFLKNFKDCSVLQDFAHTFEHLDLYRKEVKKYMELRKVASFRYAEQVDFSRYKQALIKIMDDNIKASEAELLTKEIVITDKEAFEKAIAEMGSDKSKAEAIAAQTARTITEMEEKDPVFYTRFSQKISELLEAMRQKKIADIEALAQARLIHEQVMNKEDNSLPESIKNIKGADIFYRNLQEHFLGLGMSEEVLCQVILDLFKILETKTRIDWYRQSDTQRMIKSQLDDYLYDQVKIEMKIDLSNDDIATLLEDIMRLALENYELFGRCEIFVASK